MALLLLSMVRGIAYPMEGYNVTFQPFSGEKPSGNFEIFANGFAGKTPLMAPNDAVARADGVAQGPDGRSTFPTARKAESGGLFTRNRTAADDAD
jgi:hypothetical protein